MGKIVNNFGRLQVPDDPIIPFIEGDGTGPDIWAAAVRVFDAAVEKAYRGKRRISWKEVYAGEKAFNKTSTPLYFLIMPKLRIIGGSCLRPSRWRASVLVTSRSL